MGKWGGKGVWWDKVRLNLPGDSNYPPKTPCMSKF